MSGVVYQFLPPLSDESYESLKADIADRGVMVPVEYDDAGNVLDGHHRLRACAELGVDKWPRVVRTFADEADKRTHARQLNIARRHLTAEQRRALIAEDLKERPERSNRQVAGELGVDDKTVAAVRNDLEGRAEIPHVATVTDTKGRVQPARKPTVSSVDLPGDDGEAAVKSAASRLRKGKAKQNTEKRAAVAAAKAVVPDGQYGCIVVDPPWPMTKIDRDVRPNQVGFDYPTMSLDDLMAFPLPPLAADDCHLFVWTTQRFMPAALKLTEVWGFNYCLTMVWHKPGGFQPVGLPQYNCEFVVYARKGAPVFAETKAFPCCFHAQRREHSRKPDEFYNTIQRVTAGPRIDVFSREKRAGFDQFGNEPDKFGETA